MDLSTCVKFGVSSLIVMNGLVVCFELGETSARNAAASDGIIPSMRLVYLPSFTIKIKQT